MALLPWNKDAVTIIKAEGGTALSIRATKEGDNPDYVFSTKPGKMELESLFATLAGSNMPVMASNFAMYGTKLVNGRAQAIVAAERVKYEKDGETREANYMFSPKQLDDFAPVSFAIMTKFINRKGGGKAPVPLFLAYALPYERRASESMGFQRVTVRKVTETAKADGDAPEGVKRRNR